MLSAWMDRSSQVLSVALMAAACWLCPGTLVSQSNNSLRTDHANYQVPNRISSLRDESYVDSQETDNRTRRVRRRSNEQPVYRDSRVRTQGTVVERKTARRTPVKRTGYQQGTYIPQHLRASQQSPIVGGTGPMRSTVSQRLTGINEEEIYYDSEIIGDVDEFIDGGNGCGECDDCAIGGPCLGGYCDRANQGVCGCGDFYNCPICRECWLLGFGGIICNTEFIAGAHSFDLINDGQVQPNGPTTSHFGFHAGTNIGLTLKRLTCGLVSGQVGATIYQSDFGGDGVFTNETREQVFLTAGFFRRVDYGLQFGVVADILFEDWFYLTEMAQIRSELSYVYGNGAQFGFRWMKGVQDGGDGHPLGVQPDVLDTYRFFARLPAFNGLGYAEAVGGFSEEQHGIIGAQTDINLTERISIQSGFTYLWYDEIRDDGWNMAMRVVLRPPARNWYRNYHRPLLPVADNGSMITIWR